MSKGMLRLVANNEAVKVRETQPAEEITKATIDRLTKRPKSGRDEYIQDAEVPGFKLRRTRQGTVVFFFHGRVRGGEGATKGKLVKRSHRLRCWSTTTMTTTVRHVGGRTSASSISSSHLQSLALTLTRRHGRNSPSTTAVTSSIACSTTGSAWEVGQSPIGGRAGAFSADGGRA